MCPAMQGIVAVTNPSPPQGYRSGSSSHSAGSSPSAPSASGPASSSSAAAEPPAPGPGAATGASPAASAGAGTSPSSAAPVPAAPVPAAAPLTVPPGMLPHWRNACNLSMPELYAEQVSHKKRLLLDHCNGCVYKRSQPQHAKIVTCAAVFMSVKPLRHLSNKQGSTARRSRPGCPRWCSNSKQSYSCCCSGSNPGLCPCTWASCAAERPCTAAAAGAEHPGDHVGRHVAAAGSQLVALE